MRRFENAQQLAAAVNLALSRIAPLSETEEIAVPEAYGRVLAEEIICSLDLPGFSRATMDGYAVRAQDLQRAEPPLVLKIVGAVEMGQDPQMLPTLKEDEALEITTGGPLPPGADAVVRIEETERLSSDSIKIFSSVAPGMHLIAADSDFKRGERVFYAGHRLRAIDMGALIALNMHSVKVLKRARVGILSTGDELIAAGEPLHPGEIRETNSYVLSGLLGAQGAEAHSYPIVPDDRARLREAVEQAVRESDFLLISGGSSVGARDWTLEILQELGEVLVDGLQIRPGKPTIFAIIDEKPVVGLPGNPVSCALVFEKFVRPLLAKRSGLKILLPAHRLVPARLLTKVESVKGREDFVAVRLKLDDESGKLFAEPVRGHTNNISTLVRADGILSVPADLEKIEMGVLVWVELL